MTDWHTPVSLRSRLRKTVGIFRSGVRLAWRASPAATAAIVGVLALEAALRPFQLHLSRLVIDRAVANEPLLGAAVVAAMALAASQLLSPLSSLAQSLAGDRLTAHVGEKLIIAANRWTGLARFEDPAFQDDLHRARNRLRARCRSSWKAGSSKRARPVQRLAAMISFSPTWAVRRSPANDWAREERGLSSWLAARAIAATTAAPSSGSFATARSITKRERWSWNGLSAASSASTPTMAAVAAGLARHARRTPERKMPTVFRSRLRSDTGVCQSVKKVPPSFAEGQAYEPTRRGRSVGRLPVSGARKTIGCKGRPGTFSDAAGSRVRRGGWSSRRAPAGASAAYGVGADAQPWQPRNRRSSPAAAAGGGGRRHVGQQSAREHRQGDGRGLPAAGHRTRPLGPDAAVAAHRQDTV